MEDEVQSHGRRSPTAERQQRSRASRDACEPKLRRKQLKPRKPRRKPKPRKRKLAEAARRSAARIVRREPSGEDRGGGDRPRRRRSRRRRSAAAAARSAIAARGRGSRRRAPRRRRVRRRRTSLRRSAAEIELEKLISDSLYLDNQAHAVVVRMRDMDSRHQEPVAALVQRGAARRARAGKRAAASVRDAARAAGVHHRAAFAAQSGCARAAAAAGDAQERRARIRTIQGSVRSDRRLQRIGYERTYYEHTYRSDKIEVGREADSVGRPALRNRPAHRRGQRVARNRRRG